jgi:hypothetical protein
MATRRRPPSLLTAPEEITFLEMHNDLKARSWIKQVKAGERLPDSYALMDDLAFKEQHSFIIRGEGGSIMRRGEKPVMSIFPPAPRQKMRIETRQETQPLPDSTGCL